MTVSALGGQEVIADMANPGGGFVKDVFVQRATDPVVSNVGTPIDFAAQFPTPLDPTEVIAMCEEISLLNAIPEKETGLQTEIWRELNELAFTSGSNYLAFADGACPEEYYHDGDNTTVNLKNIGAKKSLTLSDIKHSMAVINGGSGIERLLGAFPAGGLPGSNSPQTIALESIASLKAKEIKLGMALVLNGEDRLLAVGDATARPLEFDGIEKLVVTGTSRSNASGVSGTFSADDFDAWLAEACAVPTHIFGHPQAIQTMMSKYFQLGFQGSQLVNFNGGSQIVPGFSFAGFVETGVGRLTVVADRNFTKTASFANSYSSNLYALRMTHNGVPLVYRSVQFPLSLTDLAPGCTSVAFQVWKKEALIVKAKCIQGMYRFFQFPGREVTQCASIG
jgi:hypothetical protein